MKVFLLLTEAPEPVILTSALSPSPTDSEPVFNSEEDIFILACVPLPLPLAKVISLLLVTTEPFLISNLVMEPSPLPMVETPFTDRFEASNFRLAFELFPVATVKFPSENIELSLDALTVIFDSRPMPTAIFLSTCRLELLSIFKFNLPAAEIPPFMSP